LKIAGAACNFVQLCNTAVEIALFLRKISF